MSNAGLCLRLAERSRNTKPLLVGGLKQTNCFSAFMNLSEKPSEEIVLIDDSLLIDCVIFYQHVPEFRQKCDADKTLYDTVLKCVYEYYRRIRADEHLLISTMLRKLKRFQLGRFGCVSPIELDRSDRELLKRLSHTSPQFQQRCQEYGAYIQDALTYWLEEYPQAPAHIEGPLSMQSQHFPDEIIRLPKTTSPFQQNPISLQPSLKRIVPLPESIFLTNAKRVRYYRQLLYTYQAKRLKHTNMQSLEHDIYTATDNDRIFRDIYAHMNWEFNMMRVKERNEFFLTLTDFLEGIPPDISFFDDTIF